MTRSTPRKRNEVSGEEAAELAARGLVNYKTWKRSNRAFDIALRDTQIMGFGLTRAEIATCLASCLTQSPDRSRVTKTRKGK